MECWGRYLDLKGGKWQKAGEDCVMRASRFVPLAKYYPRDLVKGGMWYRWKRRKVRWWWWWYWWWWESGRKDLGVYGIVTVRWTLRRIGRCGPDVAGSVQGQMAGSCVYGNELWGFLRMRGIWWVRRCWLCEDESCFVALVNGLEYGIKCKPEISARFG